MRTEHIAFKAVERFKPISVANQLPPQIWCKDTSFVFYSARLNSKRMDIGTVTIFTLVSPTI